MRGQYHAGAGEIGWVREIEIIALARVDERSTRNQPARCIGCDCRAGLMHRPSQETPTTYERHILAESRIGDFRVHVRVLRVEARASHRLHTSGQLDSV